MKRNLLSTTLTAIICSICITGLASKKEPAKAKSKLSAYQKQVAQLQEKISKYDSKTIYYQKKATKYQKDNKPDMAKAFSKLAESNKKLVNGLKTICESKESFISNQQKIIDNGTTLAKMAEGNIAMFPSKKTTIANCLKALNKCIDIYDTQSTISSKDGSNTEKIDYEALSKALKEHVIGLESVMDAQNEISKIKSDIKKIKKTPEKYTKK